MSLSYSHEFHAVDIVDCILDGIAQDIEHEVRVVQHIDEWCGSHSFALVCDTGYLFVSDYEANSYGFDNNTYPIQRVLKRCGAPLTFIL